MSVVKSTEDMANFARQFAHVLVAWGREDDVLALTEELGEDPVTWLIAIAIRLDEFRT